ncbi:restriction endonuclease subunit S [Altericista sp. CCNU0014]|uniref:restriction endonuclease subunit S n=1 Tax=Altericista sp. CCNU0014 TaxID=3082949 RepID=UPI0038501E48
MQVSFGVKHDVLRKYGIPDGWRVCEVNDLTDIVGGGTPSRTEGRYWSDGDIPWATPTDLTALQAKYISGSAECITQVGLEESSATLLPQNSILYTSRATIGAKAITTIPIATNQGFSNFIPHDVDSEFFYYLLDLLTPIIKRLGSGTTFDEVSKRDIRKIWCALPPPEEQKAIAQVLDAADIAIEQIREAINRAQQFQKSLLRDLLSNGIDSNGQIKNPGKTSSKFSNSSLGQLPSNWKLSAVSEQFEIQTGFTINQNRHPYFHKRQYLRVANVQRDFLNLNDVQELEASDSEMALRTLEVDDLLVVEGHADRLQIGRCARVTEKAEGLTFQNHLFRLRANNEITPYFGCLWLNSTYALKYWNARCATSSGLNTINQRMLRRLIIPVPSAKEQEMISEINQAHKKYIEALIEKRQKLLSLKNSLMHDLLTGKKRINPDKLLSP